MDTSISLGDMAALLQRFSNGLTPILGIEYRVSGIGCGKPSGQEP